MHGFIHKIISQRMADEIWGNKLPQEQRLNENSSLNPERVCPGRKSQNKRRCCVFLTTLVLYGGARPELSCIQTCKRSRCLFGNDTLCLVRVTTKLPSVTAPRPVSVICGRKKLPMM